VAVRARIPKYSPAIVDIGGGVVLRPGGNGTAGKERARDEEKSVAGDARILHPSALSFHA
jgi:hypothetical protein